MIPMFLSKMQCCKTQGVVSILLDFLSQLQIKCVTSWRINGVPMIV